MIPEMNALEYHICNILQIILLSIATDLVILQDKNGLDNMILALISIGLYERFFGNSVAI